MRQSIKTLSPKFLFKYYSNQPEETKKVLREFIDKRLGVISSSNSQVSDNQDVKILQEKSPLNV